MAYNVQTLRLLMRGYDMAAIAAHLHKSESAVKDAPEKLKAQLVAYCQEQGFKPARPEERSTFLHMGDIFYKGLRIVRLRPTQLAVLGVTLFCSLTLGLDRLWVWHLVNRFDLPILFGNNALAFFGFLELGGMLLSILLVHQVEKRFEVLETRRVGRLMLAITAVTAVSIAAFGWVPFLGLASGLYLVIYSLGELIDPLLIAWMNQRLDSDVRATILSLTGQAEAIGQAVGSLLIGALANAFTVPPALLAASGLLIPALVFIRRANRYAAKQNLPLCR